jgi:phosphoglycerol transferase MdoB-like AlkP superfamily enzyme
MIYRELFHIRLLLRRLGIVLLLFTFCRFVFYLFNIDQFPHLEGKEWFYVLFFGMRYDVAAIIAINSLFILLHIVPNPWRERKKYQWILKGLFYAVNGTFLFFEAADFIYFEFAQERTSTHILGLRQDIIQMIPAFLLDFWYVILIGILLIWVIEKLYKRTQRHFHAFHYPRKLNYPLQILIAFVFMGFSFVGLRGGIQQSPLSMSSGSTIIGPDEMPLMTNTTFTILNSLINRKLKPVRYFDEKKVNEVFKPVQDIQQHPFSEQKPNIVVILLESFSKEYTGYYNNGKGYTPFLDSLMAVSLTFDHAYANGKHSIDAIPAVTVGIPALMNDAFIASHYFQNDFEGIGSILSETGYKSLFFHGGNNGTLQFDKFIRKAGFDDYYGRDEFNNDQYFDDNWGIFDEPFLQYATGVLDNQNEPFFALMFTLSSHHPFVIPEKYKGKFKKGPLKIQESIGYTDYALKQFFKTASKSEWYENTIFIITADHTGPLDKNAYKTKTGLYAVPLFIYSPGIKTHQNTDFTAQQTDIFPTVLQLAGYSGPVFSFGSSLLEEKGFKYSINQINGVTQIVSEGYSLQFNGTQSIGLYELEADPLLKQNLLNTGLSVQVKLENKLKAIIQQYRSALISDKMKPS